MDIGRKIFIAVLPLFTLLFAGCEKSAPPSGSVPTASSPLPAQSTPRGEAIFQLHWLGKKQIATDTNATNIMAIWNLPESVRLEAQTLDKLSIAPWKLFQPEAKTSNAPVALLRSLLDDMVGEESYVEIHRVPDHSVEIAFAIRLKDARTGFWVTNLAVILESLTRVRPIPSAGNNGWSLKGQFLSPESAVAGLRGIKLIELVRDESWLLVGAASGTNTLLADFRARIARNHTPHSQSATNFWLEADVALPRVIGVLSSSTQLPQNTPDITVTINGDAGDVRTMGQLKFQKPLALEFEPWNIATNLVDSSFTGFTAVRGFRPWLTSLESSNRLFAEPQPNQAVIWSYYGAPAQTWFAMPVNKADDQVHHFGTRLMDIFNPLLSKTDFGNIGWSDKTVRWLDMPFIPAFIRAVQTNGNELVFGGTLDGVEFWSPPPQQMIQTITDRTNLFYYDWEITGQRIFTWLYISQVLRMISNKAQLSSDSLSIVWLRAVQSRLGNCTTMVTQIDPVTLNFSRKSGLGFAAIELNLIADWLESPEFPFGLHTFRAADSSVRQLQP